MKLALRKTWPDRENDYAIWLNDQRVGRMYEMMNGQNRKVWMWSLHAFGPQDDKMRGIVPSLDDAKREAKASIERLLSLGVSPLSESVSGLDVNS